MSKISVIGSGSFGCALAIVLCDNGHEVILYTRNDQECLEFKKSHTCGKLPGILLPSQIIHTSDLEFAVTGRDMVVMAVPSVALRKSAEKIAPYIQDGTGVITVSKGIEEDTLYTQADILKEVLPMARVGVLCGPSHAEEVARRLPTLVVAGSEDEEFAHTIQEAFMNDVFRVYTSPDVIGIELGASLKNVIALAAGMLDGLGMGDNAQAALITRGVKEISELAIKMGARPETLMGLCGIGDLIVTCQSKHSRNRRAGVLIGQGKSAKEAVSEVNMVVEGINCARASLLLGKKYDVNLPIIEIVNRVLFDGYEPKRAVESLMKRSPKAESVAFRW